MSSQGMVSLKDVMDLLTERGVFDAPALSEAPLLSYSDLKAQMKSVIKIFCQHAMPNFSMPWQIQRQEVSTSSGFVIEGRRILCNAHGIAFGTNVQVRRHGDAKKYLARVVHVGHACDLAILEVDDAIFWDGLVPLELGDVPELQDRVTVVGYPTGGDNICITSGVVSRVGVGTYAHSDELLLTIQIDAAINPGNSGGPAFCGDKVVGVAFESLDNAENCGFIIPVPVIKHFVDDVDNGGYTGFPLLNIIPQSTENKCLRQLRGIKTLTAVVRELYPEFMALRDAAIAKCLADAAVVLPKSEMPEKSEKNEKVDALPKLSRKEKKEKKLAEAKAKNETTTEIDINTMSDSLVTSIAAADSPFANFSISTHSATYVQAAEAKENEGVVFTEEWNKHTISFSIPSGIDCPSTDLLLPPGDNSEDNYGLVVTKIIPLSQICGLLMENDVLMAFNGVPIAADGTINFRDGERVAFTHLFSSKFIGDRGEAIVLRQGKVLKMEIPCEPRREMVRWRIFDSTPAYFVFMGLVFVVLSGPFLESEFGPKWEQKAPISLCESLFHALRRQKYHDEQIVILSQVLAHESNMGYDQLAQTQIAKVNGVEVRNLAHLAQLICDFVHQDKVLTEETKETKSIDSPRFLQLSLSNGSDIILDVSKTEEVHNSILQQHQIPLPGSSADIRPVWPLPGAILPPAYIASTEIVKKDEVPVGTPAVIIPASVSVPASLSTPALSSKRSKSNISLDTTTEEKKNGDILNAPIPSPAPKRRRRSSAAATAARMANAANAANATSTTNAAEDGGKAAVSTSGSIMTVEIPSPVSVSTTVTTPVNVTSKNKTTDKKEKVEKVEKTKSDKKKSEPKKKSSASSTAPTSAVSVVDAVSDANSVPIAVALPTPVPQIIASSVDLTLPSQTPSPVAPIKIAKTDSKPKEKKEKKNKSSLTAPIVVSTTTTPAQA